MLLREESGQVDVLEEKVAEMADGEGVVPVVIGRVPVATFDQHTELGQCLFVDSPPVHHTHVIKHAQTGLQNIKY